MLNLFQISDPHFGRILSNTRESLVSSGRNIHDFRLCEALHEFWHGDVYLLDGVSDDDQFILLMNGDLTSKGHEDEFKLANTFLHSEHVVVHQHRDQYVGLRQPAGDGDGRDLYAAVPGNHDHGNGSWVWPFVLGHSPSTYDFFPRRPPFIGQSWCSEGLELCIFGIDSCSMYEDGVNLAPSADGGFSESHRTEFAALVRRELDKPLAIGCSHRTAAILCHHPWSADGPAGPLCPFCVRWLYRLAAELDIPIVMTGHTHRTLTQLHESLSGLKQSRPVREVRCPTTLQAPAKLHVNHQSPGLWWHRVGIEGDKIVWEGTLLLYAGSSFQTAGRPSQTETASGKPVREIWYRDAVPSIGGVSVND